MLGDLSLLYGPEQAGPVMASLERRLESHAPSPPPTAGALDQSDAVLICYPDQLRAPGRPPLRVLSDFLVQRVADLISGVHLLPFSPSSSDDGFSVIDYRLVDPALGSWEDVGKLARRLRLMIDAVVNHVSAQSEWFRAFRRGASEYAHFFITADPSADLSAVVRPRDLPLLTPLETARGRQHLWTTFSADQFDLNYAHPQVLLEVLDLLLFYAEQGAQIIRLDAVAFLWKEPGTTCLHLPQTHALVRLMRSVLEAAAPWVLLITETNVPHAENLSYFGDGTDEAHLVYQFALPPLVLHTLTRGDASQLTHWASELRLPSERVTFFNFLASHDGIGLRPAVGILSDAEVQSMLDLAVAGGGGVSQRSGPHGKPVPYELNINYLEALAAPAELEREPGRSASRFLLAHAILLTLQGLPGIYFHSLVGSRNDHAGVALSGRLRSINRQKLELAPLLAELSDPSNLRSRVWRGFAHLLHARRAHPAFSPWAEQHVLDLGPALFALLREDREGGRRAACLHEVAGLPTTCRLRSRVRAAFGRDLLSGEGLDLNSVRLAPYQARWIDLEEAAPT